MAHIFTDKKEIEDYAIKINYLLNLVSEKRNDLYIPILGDYFHLLKIKSENGLLEELSINEDSGMLSLNETSILKAEKTNLELGYRFSFDFEEIRGKIIKKLDNKEFDISEELGYLSKRYYLSMLESSSIDNDFSFSAIHQENCKTDDLVRFNMTGLNLLLTHSAPT